MLRRKTSGAKARGSGLNGFPVFAEEYFEVSMGRALMRWENVPEVGSSFLSCINRKA